MEVLPHDAEKPEQVAIPVAYHGNDPSAYSCCEGPRHNTPENRKARV